MPPAERLRVASPMVAASAMAMPAMPKPLPALAVSCLRQPGEAEDEQQRRDDVGRGRGRDRGHRADRRSGVRVRRGAVPRENMPSIRRVTAKPPNMLMLATRIATNASTVTARVPADLEQGPDDDDPRDRVGHRHQRRVQRVVHVPDDVEADDDGQGEDGEVLDQRVRREPGEQEQQRRGHADQRVPPRRGSGALRRRVARAARGRRRRPVAADTCTGGGGQSFSPSRTTVIDAGRRRRGRAPPRRPCPGVSSFSRLTTFGAVQLGGLGRQPAGEVGVADDRDAVVGDHDLVGHRAGHVAALPAAMSTITLPGCMLRPSPR